MTSMSIDYHPTHGGYPTATAVTAERDNLKHKLTRFFFGPGINLNQAAMAAEYALRHAERLETASLKDSIISVMSRSRSRSGGLLGAFVFSETTQGNAFWWDIYTAMSDEEYNR